MHTWSRFAMVGANVSHPVTPIFRFRKPVIFGALAVSLVLFGDILLPVLAHGLILILEVLEALFDHMLESVFDVSPWTAQLITAWTGFFVFLGLLWIAIIRIRRLYRTMKVKLALWLESAHS